MKSQSTERRNGHTRFKNLLTGNAKGGTVRAMDPEETLSAMFDALASGDQDQAFEHAENLQDWLRRGGFVPSIELKIGTRRPQILPAALSRAFVETALRLPEQRPVHQPNPGRDPQHG